MSEQHTSGAKRDASHTYWGFWLVEKIVSRTAPIDAMARTQAVMQTGYRPADDGPTITIILYNN